MVSDDQSREVDGQVAVSLDQIREGEGEEDEGQQQHGVERMVDEVDLVDGPDGQAADQIPGHGSDDELHDQMTSPIPTPTLPSEEFVRTLINSTVSM